MDELINETENETIRLDILFGQKENKSREYAKEMIQKGLVTVNGKVVTKPATKVTEHDTIVWDAPTEQYVSRGGNKLAAAMTAFQIDVTDKVCMDVGASTGGFTHCLLLGGAKKVYAIDTGTDQLVDSLLADPRVDSMEQTNVNSLTKAHFPEDILFVCVDVAFVSCTKIMGAVFAMLNKENGQAVILVKPQFEAGRQHLNKKGVVKSLKVHMEVLTMVFDYAAQMGLGIHGIIPSPIKGGEGNTEYLLFFDRSKTGFERSFFQKLCKQVLASD